MLLTRETEQHTAPQQQRGQVRPQVQQQQQHHCHCHAEQRELGQCSPHSKASKAPAASLSASTKDSDASLGQQSSQSQEPAAAAAATPLSGTRTVSPCNEGPAGSLGATGGDSRTIATAVRVGGGTASVPKGHGSNVRLPDCATTDAGAAETRKASETHEAAISCTYCGACRGVRDTPVQHLSACNKGQGVVSASTEGPQLGPSVALACHEGEDDVGKVAVQHHIRGRPHKKASGTKFMAGLHVLRKQGSAAYPCKVLEDARVPNSGTYHAASPPAGGRGFRLLWRRQLKLWGDHLLVLYWRRKLQQLTTSWRLLTARRWAHRWIGSHNPVGVGVEPLLNAPIFCAGRQTGVGLCEARQARAQETCCRR